MSEFYYARLRVPEIDPETNQPRWRDRIIPDPGGIPVKWDARDQSWKKITAGYADVLRNHKLRDRPGDPYIFEVCTESEVEAKAKDERRRQAMVVRQRAPGIDNATDLTDPANPKLPDFPAEQEVFDPAGKIELFEVEIADLKELLLNQQQQNDQLLHHLQQLSGQRAADANLLSKQRDSDSATLSREAALGLEDPPEPDPKTDITDVSGIGDGIAGKLANAGIYSLADLVSTDPADLSKATGRYPAICQGWINHAEKLLKE